MYDQAHTQAYINNDHLGGGLINAYIQQANLTAAFCVPYVCKKHKDFMGKTWKLCTIYQHNLHFTGFKKAEMKSILLKDHKAEFLFSCFLMFHSPAQTNFKNVQCLPLITFLRMSLKKKRKKQKTRMAHYRKLDDIYRASTNKRPRLKTVKGMGGIKSIWLCMIKPIIRGKWDRWMRLSCWVDLLHMHVLC